MASTTASAFPVDGGADSPLVVPVESLPQPSFRELLRAIHGPIRRIIPAWIMLGVCLVLATVMVVMLSILIARDGFSTGIVEFFVWGPLFLCCPATGVLILQRYPGQWVGWVMCLAGTAWIAAHTPYLYGLIGLLHPDWNMPGAVTAIQAGCFYPFGLYLLLVELPLVFPTGRLAAPWWQGVRLVGILGAFGATWSIGFGTELVFFGIYGDLANPWYTPEAITDLTNRVNGFDLVFAMAVPAVISMILRLRRATGVERLQLRWIMWDAAIVAIAYALHEGLHQTWLSDPLPESWFWFYSIVWGLALNSIAIVVAISILKLRLYDIDVVIHRSLLYGSMVALIAVAYVLLVNVVNAVAQRVDAGNPDPWVASFIVAALVALLVHPLRERLQGALNRWFFGARDDPDDVLTRLGVRLESAIAPAEVLREVTSTIIDLLRLPHAAIAMASAQGLEVVAESGVPGQEQASIPLVYQHERLGELRVTPRTPGEGFSGADREVLESIARQTAVAAYALRVSSDLQQARERLVTTREEERRRLRRDLHDGLGAQLAALTIQAGTARRSVRDDPGGAERDLDHLQGELRSAIADVRRLVYGLRPPALDEFGLVAALRSRLLAFEGASGIDETRLEVGGEDVPLPAAVEVAIYRIVEEALTNSSRHGRAHQVTVWLSHSDQVRLAIEDDGVGLPERYEPGVGVHSMRERAEELGGTFTIGASSLGGTRIEVTIPLPEASR